MPHFEQDDPKDAPDAFPIAGIGASAGGLAPTVELLRELGTESGLGVVVVHHLDPTHDSGLVEILSRATALPVTLASDGAKVEPNHVYVVPPNAGLLIENGTLRVVPRVQVNGLHLPIDQFFESLARDRDGLAAGVVLSGSGFDGTEGIKVIKREGGITFAQDRTAQYESMPRSAIATGCVDFTLPPRELARQLSRIGAHVHGRPTHAASERDYLRILSALEKSSTIDFANYKQGTVRRRIRRRLVLRGTTDLSTYADLVERDASETTALCEEILIHVTGFFREPQSFETLRTNVYPALCANRPRGASIRVWVPGCSTGEEVYSIAISLLEFLGERRAEFPLKIFGTDVSLGIIERARGAVYPESIEREVSSDRLERFFSRIDAGYQIRRNVRDTCIFARHDVTRDPPFSAIDLVSCRNLMIYLGEELQDRVLGLLHYALAEPGYLALGSSESVRTFLGFSPVDSKNKIFVRTSATPRLSFDFATTSRDSDPVLLDRASAAFSDPPQAGQSAVARDVHREADRLVLAEFAPPGVVVTHDLAIVQFRGAVGPFLAPLPGVASLNLLRMVREELRLPLRRAIDEARSTQAVSREMNVPFLVGDSPRALTLEVIPFVVHGARQRYFLVLFRETSSLEPRVDIAAVEPSASGPSHESSLRQELASTRQYLESVIEQLEAANEELRAANEEVVSSNEELRSTNEELQSAKEELQASNEELRTVNDEMIERNLEATRLSDDLSNVLRSVAIPILLVGRDMRLRRFTPPADTLFGLVASDLGRSLGEIQSFAGLWPSLMAAIPETLRSLQPSSFSFQSSGRRWYQIAVRPYITQDGRIDGTVVAIHDVDEETRATERVMAARHYAEDIVETVREGLVVLDRDYRIRTVNKAFRRSFPRAPADVEGRRLDQLGHLELGAPSLQQLVEEMGEAGTIEGYRIESKDSVDGHRVYLVYARHIRDEGLILLAFEDATEAERATDLAQRTELGDLLTGAAEGILIVEPSGRIVFVNRAAATLFGYEREELSDLSVDVLLPAREREAGSASVNPEALNVLGEIGHGQALVGRRKDGTEFPMEVALSHMTRKTGSVVVAFVTDITRRREAEQKIRDYQDRLQRMAFDATLTEERERRRIAIALHDRLGQALALAQIKLKSVRGELEGATREAVDVAIDLLEESIVDKRTLVFELSPPVLYDLGLKEAVHWLAEDMKKRHDFAVELDDDGAEKPLDDATKGIVFRAIRELLMNVLKHAGVQAAGVSLRREGDRLLVEVNDRGVGFVSAAASDPPRREGFGLLSVSEQITRLGGTMTTSSGPQRGTIVTLRVPLLDAGAPAGLGAGANRERDEKS